MVRVSRPRQGLRRARAHGGGGGRGSDQAPFGADVLLPPRQGAVPSRATGDSQARPGGGRGEKTRGGGDPRPCARVFFPRGGGGAVPGAACGTSQPGGGGGRKKNARGGVAPPRRELESL